VTCGEDEAKHVVVDRIPLIIGCLGQIVRESAVPLIKPLTAAPCVNRSALGNRCEPCSTVVRHAVLRPGLEGLDDRFLGHVLGEAGITGHLGERRDNARALDAPDGLDRAPNVHHGVIPC
jgi:hypothetical protein